MDQPPAYPGNLPLELPALHGREAELSKLVSWLRRCRVVTILGPVACDNTALALHTAASLRQDFPDGAFYINLDQTRFSEAVFQSILLRVLGVGDTSPGSLSYRLKEALAFRKLLLIFDNLESERDITGPANALVRATRNVHIILVSRDLTACPTGMLAVVPGQPGLARFVRQFPAGATFLGRLKAAAPDFEPDEASAAHVLALCARFANLPQAEEWIAHQAGVLPPADVLEQLVRKLETDLARQPVPAQDSPAKILFEWVEDLLPASGRECLRRLAVFAGDFRLESAVEVCRDDLLDAQQIGAELGLLVQRGLVCTTKGETGRERYFLPQLVHETGLERLEPRQAATVRRQHALHYARLAERAEPELIGERQIEWMKLLEAEYPNLRAAMLWSIEQNQAELAARLTVALFRYWNKLSYFNEGSLWLEKAVGMRGEVPLPLQVRLERCLGALYRQQNDFSRAERHFGESLRLARLHGDQGLIAQSLNGMAVVQQDQHNWSLAQEYYEEGLQLARASNDQVAAGNLLANLSLLAIAQGRYEDADRLLTEARDIYQARGDLLGVAGVLANWAGMNIRRGRLDEAEKMIGEAHAYDNLDLVSTLLSLQGELEYYRGNLDGARQLITKSLGLIQTLGEKAAEAGCLVELARIASDQGDAETARLHLAEAAVRIEREDPQADLSSLLETAATFAVSRRRPAEAARLYAAAEAQRARFGKTRPEVEAPRFLRDLETLRALLGEGDFLAHWQAGLALAPATLLALVLAIE